MKEDKPYGDFETQRELDAEYDVENAVEDFRSYLTEYQTSSKAVRNLLQNRTVANYGHTLMERLTVYPADVPFSPVLIFIHGGYWKIGTGDEYDFIAAGPARAGFTVVIVTYELAPKVNIPEMVRQVRASVAWTAKHIGEYNGDTGRIFLAGHSAGAHLSAMTIDTHWQNYGLAADTIKGMLLISGLYDLEPVSQCFVQPAVRITAEHILWYSPARILKTANIPLTIVWGDLETPAFRNQSFNYYHAWKRVGNQATSLLIAQKNHFSILNEFETADGELTKALITLLHHKRTFTHYDQ